MDFSFQYKVEPVNLWILSIMNIYRSFMGVVNIVFTLSMVLLAGRFWMDVSQVIRILIILGFLLFPVIQPLMIFIRSRKIISGMPDDMRIHFDSKGMDILSGDKISHTNFADLKSIIRFAGMLIIYTRSKQGFLLNREVLGDKGAKLYNFLSKHVQVK